MTALYATGSVYQFNLELDESVPGAECTFEVGQPDISNSKDIDLGTVSAECTFEVGEPICSSTIILTIAAECSFQVGTPTLSVASHSVRNAVYWGDNRRPNCILVMGQETTTGNLVFGYAEDGVESERDPRLYWYANSFINSFDLAQDVADNLLSKLRLDAQRGQMVIPPNLAQEQWDVINSTDTVTGTDSDFRIKGWTLRYDRQAPSGADFTQILKLTNV
jgi:hypothetical protein